MALPPARGAVIVEDRSAGAGDARPDRPSLTCSTGHVAGVVVLACAGDIDLATRRGAESALLDAVDAADRCVVVDLAGVTHLASAGIAVLLDGRERAAARGLDFHVVGATQSARRILQITGLDTVLGLRAQLSDVLADLDG